MNDEEMWNILLGGRKELLAEIKRLREKKDEISAYLKKSYDWIWERHDEVVKIDAYDYVNDVYGDE